MRKFLIAIPFYKNESFIDAFIEWVNQNPLEMDLIEDVLILNDCPTSNLTGFLKTKCIDSGFKYFENQVNLGYLLTANIAIDIALRSNLNLILLNSDTVPYSNFVSEISNCFNLDSNLGIIAPRSNNATICNLYNTVRYLDNNQKISEFTADFERFKQLTPQVTYSPVVTGFCFSIRWEVMNTFGDFDKIFSPGYEEENDFCLRVSARGIRVGIANHAFVAHLGGKSFGLNPDRDKLKHKHHMLINNKYPYYENLIRNYRSNIDTTCIYKIAESLNRGETLLIDATHMTACYNGTNKLIVEFLSALSELGYNFDIAAGKEALIFHKVENLAGIHHIESTVGMYKAGIRLGQPFDMTALTLVPQHSVFSICIFFDVIAHDCPQLSTENPEIDGIWTLLPYLFSDISFISKYSLDQFSYKFGKGTAKLDGALLPLVISEKIIMPNLAANLESSFVLVFGNKFTHKGVDLAISELPIVPGRLYLVLGNQFDNARQDITFLVPGLVTDVDLDQYMSNCEFIIFPSFAEGFGFPILEALSYRKNIYCRMLPPFLEIYDALELEQKKYLHFVSDFRLDGNRDPLARDVRTNLKLISYAQYVNHVIGISLSRSPADLYSNFKSRIIYLERMMQYRPVHFVTQRGLIFRCLRNIYKLTKNYYFLKNASEMSKNFYFKNFNKKI